MRIGCVDRCAGRAPSAEPSTRARERAHAAGAGIDAGRSPHYSGAPMQLPTRVVRPASLGFEFEVLAGDTIIGPAIERGSWADHETALFRAHVSSGARVVDLGANVGWFAVQAVLAGA